MAKHLRGDGWEAWGIIAVGTFLRAFHCERHGFGFDEVFALNKAWQPTVQGVAEAAIVTEPSLYHFVLHALTGPGWPEWGLRGISIACSVGGLILFWRILARLTPRPVALAALALAACAPFQIMKAQAARPYAMEVLFCLGGALAVLTAAARPRARPMYGVAGCLALLAVATHPVALLWLACLPLLMLGAVPGRAGRRTAWATVAAGMPAVMLVAAWAVLIRGHVAATAGSVPTVSWDVFLLGIGEWFGAGSFLPRALAPVALTLYAAAALFGLGAEALALGRAGRRSAVPAGLLLGAAPLLLLFAAHRAGWLDSPRPRYALMAHLFLLTACARGVSLVPGTARRRWALAALLLLEAGPALRATAGGPPEPGQPFDAPVREAAALIRGAASSGEVAVSYNFEGFVPLVHYLAGALPVSYAEADPYFGVPGGYPAPVPLETAARGARGIWLLIAPVRYFPWIGPHLVADRVLRGAGFVPREVASPVGLRIEHWVRPR